jgi:hypothetical protein
MIRNSASAELASQPRSEAESEAWVYGPEMGKIFSGLGKRSDRSRGIPSQGKPNPWLIPYPDSLGISIPWGGNSI